MAVAHCSAHEDVDKEAWLPRPPRASILNTCYDTGWSHLYTGVCTSECATNGVHGGCWNVRLSLSITTL